MEKKLVEGWETERKNKQLVFSLARAWFEFLLSKNEGEKKKQGVSRVKLHAAQLFSTA